MVGTAYSGFAVEGGGEGWWRTLGRSHVFKGVLMGDQSSTTEYQGGTIAK